MRRCQDVKGRTKSSNYLHVHVLRTSHVSLFSSSVFFSSSFPSSFRSSSPENATRAKACWSDAARPAPDNGVEKQSRKGGQPENRYVVNHTHKKERCASDGPDLETPCDVLVPISLAQRWRPSWPSWLRSVLGPGLARPRRDQGGLSKAEGSPKAH